MWNEACKIAFELLKRTIIETFILIHFDFTKQISIKSDSSDFVFAEILSQIKENDEFHLVIFFSKNLVSIKCNYEIYDEELLVIIRCFEQWRFELLFTNFDVFVKMLIDHQNLKYFMFIKQLNRRQSRWVQFLTDFHFVIIYLSEKSNEKVDSLIRRAKDVSNKENDRQKQQNQILLSFERFEQQNSLQAVELIIVLESNRFSLIQKMHDQSAFNHSEINKTIKLLKKIIADQKWYETSSNTFEIVILVKELRQPEINITNYWIRYQCQIDHEQI